MLSIFERVEARGVHAQCPVADGAAESGFIEALVFPLVLERLKAFADGLFGQRADPQPLHGTFCSGLLHDPSLYEFTFLTGIAAVDDAVCRLHQLLDDGKLFFHAFVLFQLDAKA